MSEEDWTIVSKPTVTANKWDDEDDDDVKENWDDDDEDASKASSNADAQTSQNDAAASVKKKKQKALKEKLMKKDLEMQRPKTKEELLAEKLERQRLQEESDLALAQDAFGINSSGSDTSVLSSIQLASRQDFESFREALANKFSSYVRSPFYVPFLEELFREIAVGLEADDIKKLDTVLTTIFNDKIKQQKQAKGKKAKKNATIQMERDDDYSYNQSNYDEFDDFI